MGQHGSQLASFISFLCWIFRTLGRRKSGLFRLVVPLWSETVIGLGFESVRTPNCCTTLPVELPSSTHAQAVEFKRILRVPNRHGSSLFFENREQKRIEPTRKPQLIRIASGGVAQAELAGSPRGLGISQT